MKDSVKITVTSEAAAEQAHRDIIKSMNDHGYCVVTVKAGSRSLSQNDLYWEWMTVLADEINAKKKSDFSKDEVHDWMRHNFLGYEDPKQIGRVEIKPQLKTTTRLTVGEMYHYMSQIDAWSADCGIYLPRPSDCQYEKVKVKHESGQ